MVQSKVGAEEIDAGRMSNGTGFIIMIIISLLIGGIICARGGDLNFMCKGTPYQQECEDAEK